MSEATNWVRRRAQRERILDSQAAGVWHNFQSALQDACDDYNENYCAPSSREVEYKLENGNRILITRTLPADKVARMRDIRMHVVVAFGGNRPTIMATRQTSGSATSNNHNFHISSDDREAFIVDKEQRIDLDEASKRILEPLLFPPGEQRRPISNA
jgi:hypothetical protein